MTLPTVVQKQLSIALVIKRCCKNMQQVYMRTPMSKCDFNKVAKLLYLNHTLAWYSFINLLHIFRKPFPESTSGGLLLTVSNVYLCLSTPCKGCNLSAFTIREIRIIGSFFYIKSKSNIANSLQ